MKKLFIVAVFALGALSAKAQCDCKSGQAFFIKDATVFMDTIGEPNEFVIIYDKINGINNSPKYQTNKPPKDLLFGGLLIYDDCILYLFEYEDIMYYVKEDKN